MVRSRSVQMLCWLLFPAGCLTWLGAAMPVWAQAPFTDATAEVGMGASAGGIGLAWADYDNDGDPDLYVANANGANNLYRNNADGTFTDVIGSTGLQDAGASTGVTWADYDRDGDLDLYMPKHLGQANRLFRNDGNGTFADATAGSGAGLDDPGNTIQAAWGDYDSDGYLDLYISNENGGSNRLFRNLGNGSFNDVTHQVGPDVARSGGSRGIAWADYDGDGWLDLYVCTMGPSYLYRNLGNGEFADVTADAGGIGPSAVSVSWGDFNDDGNLDLVLSGHGPTYLYRNNGDCTFSEITSTIGVSIPNDGRGTGWGDYDNDGLLDLFLARPGPNLLLHNNGNGSFSDVTATAGTGVGSAGNTHPVTWVDYNGDGYLDLAFSDANIGSSERLFLFRNTGVSGGNWLAVKANGTGSNNNGIGARATLYAGGRRQTREVQTTSGYTSQSGNTLYFGLASAATADSVVVRWPSGTVDRLFGVTANQTVTVTEGATHGSVPDPEPGRADTLALVPGNLVVWYSVGDGSGQTQSHNPAEVLTFDSGIIRILQTAPTIPENEHVVGIKPNMPNIAGSQDFAAKLSFANAHAFISFSAGGESEGAFISYSSGRVFTQLHPSYPGGAEYYTAADSGTFVIEKKRDALTLYLEGAEASRCTYENVVVGAGGANLQVYVTPTHTGDRIDITRLVITRYSPRDSVVVSVPDTAARYAQTTTVPMWATGLAGRGVVSAEAFAAYDGDLLLSPVVEAGSVLTSKWTVESHVVQGVGTPMDTLRIAMATDVDTLTGAGSLVNLRFQVADVRHPASTPVRFAHVLFNAGTPVATTQDGSVTVVGTDGSIDSSPAAIHPRQTIGVTVWDADADRDTLRVDSVRVDVRNGNQTEGLWVGETGVHTGVYAGSIGTVFSRVPVSGDGVVQAKAGDWIVCSAVDSLTAAGSTVVRYDSTRVVGGKSGSLRPTVVLQPGDTLRVKVVDGDLSGSAPVGLRNQRTGEQEVVLLPVVSWTDSVFYGRVGTEGGGGAGPAGDGRVRVGKGDSVVVSYVDTLTAEGGVDSLAWVVRAVNPFGDADGNGLVQAYDASRVLYHRLHPYLVGLDSLSANVDSLAPLGPITAYDAALILQKRVGRIWRFPVQTPWSVNQPQPESRLYPKVVTADRLVEMRQAEGGVSVWIEDRGEVISGELELEGVVGPVRLGEGMGDYLLAWDAANGKVRVVFAGAEPVSGPGELVRLESAGSSTPRLTRIDLNDGQVGVRLGSGVLDMAPRAHALHAPQPNPFNPSTIIRYELPQASAVRLEVYDALGQRVRVLVEGERSAGAYAVEWDGRNEAGGLVSSGVYLCRLKSGSFTQVRRMVLLK